MKASVSCLAVMAAVISGAAFAQDAPGPTDKKVEYSPYVEETFPNQVLFGDSHLHTAYSADAGLVGCIGTPDDAYRFAKGETIVSSTGVPAKLKRPLDWLVVSDHAANLGLPIAIADSDPQLLANEWGEKIHDIAKKGGVEAMIESYEMWMLKINALDDPLADQKDLQRTMWRRVTEAADQHNTPGAFTAFIGFEWTLTPDGNNMHRNVTFRGGKDKGNPAMPGDA